MLPFDASRFTVVGETLAAGYAHFGVYRDGQRWSFPALMARQMGVEFPQVLLEPPGICYSPGFEQQSVLMGTWLQSTVFETLPPEPPANFAVPGCTLRDAVERRARQPLICREDVVQTGLNLIAAPRALALGEHNLPTLTEAAAARCPTLLLVELGFAEAVDAAVRGEPGRMPECDSFRKNLSKLLSIFPQTTVVVLNVPDPFDTPHFLNVDQAAEALRVTPLFLSQTYDVRSGDRIRVPGVHEIGGQLFAREISTLPADMLVRQDAVTEIRCRIHELNAAIRQTVASQGAYYCDLRTAMLGLSHCDLLVSGRRFTGGYLGGLFGINGLYPGRTGQALLANQILAGINQATGAGIPLINIGQVAEADPQRRQTPAGGRLWTDAELSTMHRRQRPAPERPAGHRAAPSKPAPLEISHYGETPLPARLSLPPNLEQILPLNPEGSYFGDAISPVHCEDPNDVMWGSSASYVFGGLALVDSHLRGNVRIRFSPPEGNVAKFTVDFDDGFVGEDAVLACPVMFRMPFVSNRVDGVHGMVSSGEVNLDTGAVSKLRIFARYSSGALNALVGVNPSFPKTPLSFVSSDIADPQSEYGSAYARFDPRPDGFLDFTFFGTRFLPLRGGIHWPLNFCGPDGPFALVPADGTIMRPHLRLSTAAVSAEGARPDLPFNSLQEFTYHTRHCAFGDAFLLHIPDLGGVAKGRSHVLGRLLVQFGLPSGGTVPVAMCSLAPGGLFTPVNDSPITQAFPGRLAPGPTGFYEMLRFPCRTYALDELSILDDPFDLPVGAVDVRTGRVLGEQLHRGFIEQDLIFALVRIEPRTPRSSFYFRGPAIFETGFDRRLRFRYRGEVHIPYPKGLQFPRANLSVPYTVVKDSALDPFLWIRAVQDSAPEGIILEGSGKEVLASIGEVFSYRFRISGSARDCFFEYINHTQGGRLRMTSLAWIGLGPSIVSGNGTSDTATFTGFGIWEKDGKRSLQPFAAQFCTNPADAYGGIQVDAGDCSNVNTKPLKESDALP